LSGKSLAANLLDFVADLAGAQNGICRTNNAKIFGLRAMADEGGEKKKTTISFNPVETGAKISLASRFQDEQIGLLPSPDDVFDAEIKEGKEELGKLQNVATEDAEALKARLTKVTAPSTLLAVSCSLACAEAGMFHHLDKKTRGLSSAVAWP